MERILSSSENDKVVSQEIGEGAHDGARLLFLKGVADDEKMKKLLTVVKLMMQDTLRYPSLPYALSSPLVRGIKRSSIKESSERKALGNSR